MSLYDQYQSETKTSNGGLYQQYQDSIHPEPSAFSQFVGNVVGGAKTVWNDIFNAPVQTTPQSFTEKTSTVGGDIALTALNTYTNTLKDAKDRMNAWSTVASDQHATTLQKGIAAGEAGIGALQTFFAPIVAASAGAEKIPILGGIATGINKFFGTVGTVGADVAEGFAQNLNVSQETKDKITPLAREIGALGLQIVAGKYGGDVYEKLAQKSSQFVDTINSELQGARAVVEAPPVKKILVAGESTTQPVSFFNQYQTEKELPIIQMGAKPKDTLPVAAYSPPEAPVAPITPTTWGELQKTNPELWDTGILRRSVSPYGAKEPIPADVHTAQSKWQNYGQNDQIPANVLYERVNSGSFKGDYVDKQGDPIRNTDGSILRDTYNENTQEWDVPTISNKDLKDNLLNTFSTKEGKDYLNKVIDALPKNPDGTITAYRIGTTGDGIQSYTLSEGMAKTFSNQGTDILPPGTPRLPRGGYKDFGVLPANLVKIDPKGIRAWSPYDAEILVESKYVNKVTKPAEVALKEPTTKVVTKESVTKEVKPQKTGEVTKAAKDINETLVKQGYEALSPELQSKYTPESYKTELVKTKELTSTNYEDAIARATGKTPVGNYEGQILFNEVERIATGNGDYQTLLDLAKSPLGKKLSEAGQALGAAGFNDNPSSPVRAIQEIQKARESAVEKVKVEATTRLEDAVKKTNTKQSWSEFVKSIQC